MVKKVIWPLHSQKQLAKAYEYILPDSYQNAEKVKADILASTRKLPDNPEIHPPDKYREKKIDYIHYNPTAEHWKLCNEPVDYKYSSAKFYETGIDEFGF